MATLDVFEYLIGNTDWSAVFNHNVVLIRDAAGRATAVPYDFDFSGLVDADYASVAPELPIRDVRQRCSVASAGRTPIGRACSRRFRSDVSAIEHLISWAGLSNEAQDDAQRYLDGFFATLSSDSRSANATSSALAARRGKTDEPFC